MVRVLTVEVIDELRVNNESGGDPRPFFRAVILPVVYCASAYISLANGRVGQSFGNDGGTSVQFGQNQLRFGRVSG